MGSISLQPELKEDQRTLKLDEHFLDQIKTGYCGRIQVSYMSRQAEVADKIQR